MQKTKKKSQFGSFALTGAEWFTFVCNLCGVFIVVGVVMSVMTFLIITDYQVKQQSNGITLTDLKGKISLYDEVLTMSARMAAAKNDTSFVTRYEQNIPKLEDAIKRAMESCPVSVQKTFENLTFSANTALIAIETQAINDVKAGNSKKALESLFSAEYENLKKVYESGLVVLLDYIFSQASVNVQLDTATNVIILCALASVIPISIIIGFDSIIQRVITSKIQDDQKKRELNHMNSLNQSFARFLPKEFIDLLEKGDIRNVKKGDSSTKDICVLFSDIRSFTDLTEKMNAKESFSFVNQILEYLAPIVSKHNGFVDKFVGDCIMALFPHSIEDSIECGFEMLTALEKYNQDVRKGEKKVEIGIGIHFGNVMIGTIGVENRMDATVISSTVNTASRVESLTVVDGLGLFAKSKFWNWKTIKIPIQVQPPIAAEHDKYLKLTSIHRSNKLFRNLTNNNNQHLQNQAFKILEIKPGFGEFIYFGFVLTIGFEK